MEPNKPLIHTTVWHQNSPACFWVSTIERSYCTCIGETRGEETLVWEFDPENQKRGNLIWQGGHICDHLAIVRFLHLNGRIPVQDDEKDEADMRRFGAVCAMFS